MKSCAMRQRGWIRQELSLQFSPSPIAYPPPPDQHWCMISLSRFCIIRGMALPLNPAFRRPKYSHLILVNFTQNLHANI